MKVAMLNITDCNFNWTDPLDLRTTRFWTSVLVGCYIAILLLVGTFLHGCVIAFERLGGDPKKRGLANMMTSQFSCMILICNWIQLPVRAFRLIMGPIHSGIIFWPWMFSLRAFFFGIIVYGTEFILMRFISIVVLKRMLPVLEDFFSIFICASNIVIVSMLSLINCFSYRACMQQIQMAGLPSFLHSYSPISPEFYTNALFFIATGLLLYAGPRIVIAKHKQNLTVNPGQGSFNVVSRNRDVVDYVGIMATAILVVGTNIVILILLAYKNVFEFLVHSSVSLIVGPCLLYGRNQEMRRFVFDMITKP